MRVNHAAVTAASSRLERRRSFESATPPSIPSIAAHHGSVRTLYTHHHAPPHGGPSARPHVTRTARGVRSRHARAQRPPTAHLLKRLRIADSEGRLLRLQLEVQVGHWHPSPSHDARRGTLSLVGRLEPLAVTRPGPTQFQEFRLGSACTPLHLPLRHPGPRCHLGSESSAGGAGVINLKELNSESEAAMA